MNMSNVLSLSGVGNPLVASFFPPLDGQWEIGLLSLYGWNAVPNVTTRNNMFHYDNNRTLVLPTGSYTLGELAHALNIRLMIDNPQKYEGLSEPQKKMLGYALINVTLNPLLNRVELVCAFKVSPAENHSLTRALGFTSELMAFRKNVAEEGMKFGRDNVIRVNCDVVQGCYNNGERSRTIYEFVCQQNSGERFQEKVENIVYFPVSGSSSLREVRVELCDRNNQRLDLRGELSLVRLHLRQHAAHI